MAEDKDAELLLAQVQTLPVLSDTEKKDPVKVNWAIYERLGIMDENIKVNMKVANITYTKANKAYDIACTVETQFNNIKKDVNTAAKFFAWIGGVFVGLAVMWEAIKDIFKIK